jgi:hypothetical protein
VILRSVAAWRKSAGGRSIFYRQRFNRFCLNMPAPFDLTAIFPRALAWAQAQSDHIRRVGAMLTPVQNALAHAVGVEHPERIRILLAQSIPAPADPELVQIARERSFIAPDTHGVTLGYGVSVRRSLCGPSSLSCRSWSSSLSGSRQLASRALTERRSAAVKDRRPPQAARASAHASLTARTALYTQAIWQAALLLEGRNDH